MFKVGDTVRHMFDQYPYYKGRVVSIIDDERVEVDYFGDGDTDAEYVHELIKVD